MHVRTLILGGGLTGLSVAYQLEKLRDTNYLVLEKEREPGGLCRSTYKNGFTFDYSGHLLHLHTPQGKNIVRELLGKNLHRVARRAFVYTGTSQVPFPFQAHLYALPPQTQKRCVEGLLSVKHAKTPPRNFEQWCLRAFGKGIYETFMRPYNTKLWGRAPRELTCEWCAPFIPAPSPQEIRQSTRQNSARKWGYNPFFYYPKTGGCGALIAALTAKISHVKTNTPVTQIDLKNKTVRAGGKIITYDFLVNTLPLPVFLHLLKGAPSLTHLADQLTAQSITVCHLALRGRPRPFSWIYCPDEQDPFYRVGLQSSFSPANAPQGMYSLYIELPGCVRPTPNRERQIYRALLQKGIISKYDEKLFSFWQTVPYAYVVYDKSRTKAVRRILQRLEKYGCTCAGRYGKWEYSFMESSLLQGQTIAKKRYNEVL